MAELRRPLREERRDAFDETAVPAQAAKLVFSASSCSTAARKRFAHEPLRVAQGERGSRRERRNDSARRGVEQGGRHDAVHETKGERIGSREALAQHKDLHRLAHADQSRQRPRAAAVRREPDLPVGGREIAVVGGDHEIACVHQRQAETGDGPVHLCHDRMRHPVQCSMAAYQRPIIAESLRCAPPALRRAAPRTSGCRRRP
jgi:hypothetical protein